MSSKWFDPYKSFLSLAVLRIVIATFMLIASVFTMIIIINSNIITNYSYIGFNGVITIFRVPLGTLALIIPIVALLAANHRSEQTKEQMKLASAQNGFSNYYKHIEEFENFCQKNVKSNAPKVLNLRKFHKLAFPYSHVGDYSVSKSFLMDLDNFITTFTLESEGLNSEEPEIWQPAVASMINLLSNYCNSNYVGEYNKTGKQLIFNGERYVIPKGSIKELITLLKIISELITETLEFDITYEKSALVEKAISFNYSALQDSNAADYRLYKPNDFSKRFKSHLTNS